MAVEVFNKTRTKINTKLARDIAGVFLLKNKRASYGLSIVFVGDKKIRDINKNFRGIDRITDILSFEGEEDYFGDLIIDYAQIKRQAKKFGNSVKEEMVFILVHGLLHLLGYSDKTEKEEKIMIKLGEKFIKNNNF
ncbi:rRNA maturation RNase YbeY [Candidatus Parcubacteria bacterium]|nr:MAG: rRNA maturation RNase YbeY [Candidatus Parcubacteria bacterium]